MRSILLLALLLGCKNTWGCQTTPDSRTDLQVARDECTAADGELILETGGSWNCHKK